MRSIFATALLFAVSSCAGGGDGDDDSAVSGCVGEEDCPDAQECSAEGQCVDPAVPWTVCPDDLQPTFTDIRDRVLLQSCGTGGSGCHSAEGSVYSGGLDLESSAYLGLLGPEGEGAAAQNIEGTVSGLFRVRPFDLELSLLVHKLSTTNESGGPYGRGMPRPTPGSICPESLQAIRTWIEEGALP